MHLLFSVDGVHVLSGYSELVTLVAQNPLTPHCLKTQLLSNLTKNAVIDENFSLSWLLRAFTLLHTWLCLCHPSSGVFIAKDIIILSWRLRVFLCLLLGFIGAEHIIIICKFGLNFLFLGIYLCHVSQVYVICDLFLLVLWPNVGVSSLLF